MSLLTQVKYAGFVAIRLGRFKLKRTHPYLANMRCPFCGDSEVSKRKARGYLYERSGSLFFSCHNCGINTGFDKFLKTVDSTQYNEYKLECLSELPEKKEEFVPDLSKFSKPRFRHFEPLKDLKKISQLPEDHGARKYVDARKIPRDTHHRLLYTPKFNKWVNSVIPDKFDEQALKNDEPRLIIPLIDANGYAFGVSGRSFRSGENVLRYITIMFDENKPKVFGLDTFDPSKKGYLLEGPIDSLFVPNSIAMVGADLTYGFLPDKNKVTIIFDNQPRNKQVVKKVEKAINEGWKTLIWPSNIAEKDINDMIKAGYSQSEIMDIIDSNSYSGLMANLKLNEWRRV